MKAEAETECKVCGAYSYPFELCKDCQKAQRDMIESERRRRRYARFGNPWPRA